MGERHQDMAFGDKNNMYEILSKLTVPEQARVPIWANELWPNPKGLNSSLVISTLARSGEFSSNKTQQLFTIVSIVYLGFLWRLSHPSAQHMPGSFNFLWVVTVNRSLAITTLACSGEYRLTNVMFPMLFVCCIATARPSGTIFYSLGYLNAIHNVWWLLQLFCAERQLTIYNVAGNRIIKAIRYERQYCIVNNVLCKGLPGLRFASGLTTPLHRTLF